MEILQSRSDSYPESVVIGPTVVLVNSKAEPFREEHEESTVEGYRYTTYRLTHPEYQEIQKSYSGNIPALRVVHLKARLADTDYVVTKIAEAVDQTALRAEYADILKGRKMWRDEINSLE